MVEVVANYQVGDNVQQAVTPPPVMTVIAVGILQVQCEWFVNGVRQTGWFSPSTLHLVTAPHTP